MTTNGSIKHIPFVKADVERAYHIYGQPEAYYRGVMTRRKVKGAETEEMPRLLFQNQDLIVDLMIVNGLVFLVSVANPLYLTMVNVLKNKTAIELGEALRDQIHV